MICISTDGNAEIIDGGKKTMNIEIEIPVDTKKNKKNRRFYSVLEEWVRVKPYV